MTRTDAIVLDLDDTLWKWCSTWHAGYTGFNEALAVHGVPDEQAARIWARMFERVGGSTIEFPPFPIDIVAESSLNMDEAVLAHESALPASRKARDAAFQLFPGVTDTLAALKGAGVFVIAHTDSPITAARYRIHNAGIGHLIDVVYSCPIFTDFGDTPEDVEAETPYVLNWTHKPDTTVLRHIIDSQQLDPSVTMYVGDSKRRDMSMAEEVGMIPVWASYGVDYPEREPAIRDLVVAQ